MKNYVSKKWYSKSNHRKFTYPSDMDEELIPMMDVFNNIPGVRTEYCCTGHGENGWYVSFKCASHFMANVLVNYFTKSIPVDETDDWQKKVQTTLPFEVEWNDTNDYDNVPEERVTIWCNELGKMSEPKRVKEYRKICEFFAAFTPRASWTKVHEF